MTINEDRLNEIVGPFAVRDLMDAEMREYLASLQTAGGAGWKRS